MATPGVVARYIEDERWHGTCVTYGCDPEALVPALLDRIVDLGGDLEAFWAEVTVPEHGWHDYPDKHRTDPRWDSGGTFDRVVDSENDDYRTDTACWALFDLDARRLDVLTTRGLEARFELDAAGCAVCVDPEVSGSDWRNRCQAYGDDDPTVTARALMSLVRRGLVVEGPRLAVHVREERGWVARLRGRGSEGVRLKAEGLEMDVRVVAFDEDGGLQQVADGRLVVPRRCLRSGDRCVAWTEAWVAALGEAIRAGRGLSFLWPAYLCPSRLLDLDLGPAELREAVETWAAGTFS